GQADLFEVVLALSAVGGFPDLLHGGHEQADQDGDDGDHDEELNQRECPANLRGAHALGLLTGEPMTGCGATRDSRREKGAGRLAGAGPPVRVSRHLHGILMDGEGASNNFLHRVPFFLWTVFPPDPRQTRYLGWVASLFPWTQTERWKDFRANQKRCPR